MSDLTIFFQYLEQRYSVGMRMVGSLLFGIGVVRIAGFAIYFSYLSLACVAGGIV